MAEPESALKAESALRPDYWSRGYKRKALTGTALIAAFLTVSVMSISSTRKFLLDGARTESVLSIRTAQMLVGNSQEIPENIQAVPLGLATDVREAKTAAQAHRESTEEAGGGEGGDAEGQGPVEEEGTIVKMMTKPPTRSPAPTPHPAHILMPIKGLEKPHMECPDGTVVDETVAYWKEWTDEAPLWKPLTKPPDASQTYYLTFEPDMAGFNNMRMSLECAVAFAAITGRTLVLPDSWSIDHIGVIGNRNVADFYDMEQLGKFLPMISMTEFLEKEAITGGLSQYPPGNRTSWIPKNGVTFDDVWYYIRDVAHVLSDDPTETVMVFEEDEDRQRLDEMRNKRRIVYYTEEMQESKLIHMTTYAKGGVRWLVLFYGVFFFGDIARDNWVKRFMRDQLHYKAEIMCPAQRVVEAIKKDAGPTGKWTAMHIRRGDFESQYKATQMSVDSLFGNIEGLIDSDTLVYIATNEKDLSYFDPMAKRFNLRFLSNYTEDAGLKDMDPAVIGNMEQVICAAATRFVGTYWSTFTNYIFRLRGYAGRELGYYFVPDHVDELVRDREHHAQSPFWFREWPDAFEDIDMGWADDGKYAGEILGWGDEDRLALRRRQRRRFL